MYHLRMVYRNHSLLLHHRKSRRRRGPAPYYLDWQDAAPQIEGDAVASLDTTLLLLDPGDPRAADWGLLPVCVPGSNTITGYEVVAIVEGDVLMPIVDTARWEGNCQQT